MERLRPEDFGSQMVPHLNIISSFQSDSILYGINRNSNKLGAERLRPSKLRNQTLPYTARCLGPHVVILIGLRRLRFLRLISLGLHEGPEGFIQLCALGRNMPHELISFGRQVSQGAMGPRSLYYQVTWDARGAWSLIVRRPKVSGPQGLYAMIGDLAEQFRGTLV